jgi:curved DNA-binding protein CbpA
MGNSSTRQYTYHQYYNAIKKDKNFNFSSINYELLDPYEVLEVRKNYTWGELKDAYKYTALLTHPDKEGGNELVFNFVTDCFKKLAYEYKARQQDKTFIDLKKQVEDYYSKDEENSKNRPPPVIDENFNERFNRSFEMCRLENEEFDFGYGDMMEQSTKKREDFKNENLFEKQKFDNKSFNSIFNKHVPAPSKEVVKYKEPEPMVLANKMSYTEIGGKRPDDYSSSIEKEGKNNLVYTDYRKAYSNTRLIDEASAGKKKEFTSIEEYQIYRDKKSKRELTEKERRLLEKKQKEEELEEQARQERIKTENRRIMINNEKASRLFLK